MRLHWELSSFMQEETRRVFQSAIYVEHVNEILV